MNRTIKRILILVGIFSWASLWACAWAFAPEQAATAFLSLCCVAGSAILGWALWKVTDIFIK